MIKQNVSLNDLTTFQIGGEAEYFVETQTAQELIEAVKWAKQKSLPFFVLGGGSNLLADDKGFKGLVIRCEISNINQPAEEQINNKLSNAKVAATAGVKLAELLEFCLKHGLSGLEWAAGIPSATVGGALYMNAGAFGANMADITENVEVLDVNDLKIKKFQFKECRFGYKETVFKKNKNLIILSVLFNLEKRDKKEIKKEITRVLNYRIGRHPMDFPSAGSIFKNPKRVSAGELIERAGLAGKKIGGAEISQKHCNFILNKNKANANDVKKLIELAKKQVKEKFNIVLEEEMEYLD